MTSSPREKNADAWFFEVRKYTDGLHDLLLFTENGIADTEAEAENIVYEVLCSELGEKPVWDTVYAVSTKVAEKTNEENNLHHIGDLEELLKKGHAEKTVN